MNLLILSSKVFSTLENKTNNNNTILIEPSYFNLVTSFKSNHVKFGVLLFLQLLSISCSLLAFYQYFTRSKLRQTISYDIIYLLLFNSFLFVTTALSLTQAYMYTSHVYPSNDIFCSFWNWLHYSLNIINLFLMALISIERNLLIFKPYIFRSKQDKYLFHYIPILFCLIFPLLFYLVAIFLCPCKQFYEYNQLLCTWPCYFGNKNWSTFDLFFNNYTPLIIIPIFCTTIFIRVLYQKRLMQLQIIKWRRDRKLIIQLFVISTLYLSMWTPLQICSLINIYWNEFFLIQLQIDYMYLFPYIIHILYPFIVLFMIHRKSFNRQVIPVTIK